jgi:hypothetical protein
VEAAGKTSHLHTLYDWGVSNTLVTHAAAKEAGLVSVKHSTMTVSGLGGEPTNTSHCYMVLVVNGDDMVQTVKAIGVARIAPLRVGEPSWQGQQENWID